MDGGQPVGQRGAKGTSGGPNRTALGVFVLPTDCISCSALPPIAQHQQCQIARAHPRSGHWAC